MFVCLTKLFFRQQNKFLLYSAIANILFFNTVKVGCAYSEQQVKSDDVVEFNLHQPSVKVEDDESGLVNIIDRLGDEQAINSEQFKLEAQEVENEQVAVPKTQEVSHSNTNVSKVLQGGVTYTVPVGTPIKLKLASVPSHPISLMDRDIEGNLYPARLNQQITARTTEDIYVNNNKIIPEGTILHGCVSKILPPKRVYRPGSLELSFDCLTTPDGKKFAFKAQADNARQSTVKTKAKGLGIIAAHTAGGAIVGALVAYQIFGLEKTISMHGYNIAAGAAAGALIATGYAVMRKGPKATLEPGDDLNMVIDSDLLMPVAMDIESKNNNVDMSELKIKIEKSKIDNDGVGGHFVTVDALLTNDGDRNFSSIDLFLEDTNGHRYPVCSGPEEDSQFLFHLEPHSQKHVQLSFLTPYPKLKQELVWIDHETKYTLIKQKVQ